MVFFFYKFHFLTLQPHFILSGLVIACALFLLAQLTVIGIWKTVQKRNKKERYLYQHEAAVAAAPPPPSAVNYAASNMVYGSAQHGSGNAAADTLGKLYDSGMTGRYGQQY